MPLYRNPYLNRVMIRDIESFYGRKKEVAKIFSRISAPHPQSISIVGPRKIGKSSLLNFISNKSIRGKYLEKPDDYAFIFIDLQERRNITLANFFRSLFELLSDELGKRVAIKEESDYSGLKKLLLRLKREKMKLIVIFDEFDAITKNKNFGADFFAFLRSIANNYDVAYITSSGRDLQELCYTQQIADSPFFNIFTTLSLRTFEKGEAIELIEKPPAESGIPLGEYTDFILDIAGFFPFFIQIACSVLFDYLREESRAKRVEFAEIKDLYLDEARVHFQYIWDHFNQDQKGVCHDVACGEAVEERREYILRDLEKAGFIFEHRGGYRLFSSIFQDYIQEISIRQQPGYLRKKKEQGEEPTKISVPLEGTPRYEEADQEAVYPKEEAKRACKFGNIIGKSQRMEEVFQLLEKVIPASVTVVITGESGTGKELVARAIHYSGERKDKKFVAQNCAALPESLLESELFGHAKGAFTGATADKKGLFEAADGGTIFLDEITDASSAIQVRLLRVLQEREIRRIGETEPRKVDVRVISASSRDLEKEVRKGRFREDLYFRLNVFSIHMPPLRQREEDIPLLAAHFLEKYSEEMNKALIGFSPAVMDLLMRYRWPGNIRELENTIERAVVIADGELILLRHLPQEILSASREFGGRSELSLEDVERAEVERALIRCGWNQTRAAQLLGISRDKLRYRIKKYEIKTERRTGVPSTIGE